MLLDGTQSINRLREDVQGITQWVESGALAERLSEGGGKASGAKPSKGWSKMAGASSKADLSSGKEKTASSSGWSAVLPSSHLKVGGMIGSVARIPLRTFAPGRWRRHQEGASSREGPPQGVRVGHNSRRGSGGS